ncbi:phosphoribosyl-dephospho-CoA transferase [Marinobacterium nitratireducens]|uniref:Phosphoribosyl-dephospho-CoA transferase n=1 Tax=Marinobacterium nitratireducens TaxID=518897 RepID=A0A917ZNK7_9GAMM|nr:malonate decarboxylase holo-ACP synthase [Marinobacterium nitratireducens]GGO86460.1 phosphoribosyl-dephospho-CoA transferase [Marinobacterium nitratireducens]
MSWRPHDLLWVQRERLLPAGEQPLPDWVSAGSGPVVVRRAPASSGLIAIGVRGRDKRERCAAFARLADVERGLTPFELCSSAPWRAHPERQQHPVLVTLEQLAPRLDARALRWGITGSLGYEFATGEAQLRPSSDLDLVIDTPVPVSRPQASWLLRSLESNGCRVDIQLETPQGAIALAEWAGPSRQVMLKTQFGPRLTDAPWAPQQDRRTQAC